MTSSVSILQQRVAHQLAILQISNPNDLNQPFSSLGIPSGSPEGLSAGANPTISNVYTAILRNRNPDHLHWVSQTLFPRIVHEFGIAVPRAPSAASGTAPMDLGNPPPPPSAILSEASPREVRRTSEHAANVLATRTFIQRYAHIPMALLPTLTPPPLDGLRVQLGHASLGEMIADLTRLGQTA